MLGKPQNIPFKATINGNHCIIIISNSMITIDFMKKSIQISYDTIRCIQCKNNMILINAIKKDKLVGYVIMSQNAKKIYKMLGEKLFI